ncbi:hypothetical protein CRM22_000879 [Opisthorchis felineus]|uniref:Cyclic nucleotide-binding domain-containing protein n=1 Tax=Opisthorchis felineus TaxID=147828 RepID=A0A4S2MD29_OPIFE|nr:hypothetical protein CRM22_000879 [Opisthorchis felineus]
MSFVALYQKVLRYFMKSVAERTESDVDTVYPWFGQQSTLFASLRQEVAKDIIRNCELEKYTADTVIVRQFEKGDCFFIILSGKVSIYVQTDEPQLSEEPTDAAKAKPDKVEDRSKLGQFVGHLERGGCFGEVALLDKESLRTATVIADCETELIVIDRTLYNRSLKEVHQVELREKAEFVNQCPTFAGWPYALLKQVGLSLRKVTMSYGAPVVRQGEPLNKMFFLLSRIEKTLGAKFGVFLCRFIRYMNPDLIKRELEYGFGMKTYCCTATCIEPSEFFVLHKNNITRLMNSRRNINSWKKLAALAEKNLVNHFEQIQLHRVPLFQHLYDKYIDKKRQAEEEQRERAARAKKDIKSVGSYEEFIPSRGAVIDQYGPGTVFYRNQQRRAAAERAEKMKMYTVTTSTCLQLHSICVRGENFLTFVGLFEKTIGLESSASYLKELERKLSQWHVAIEKLTPRLRHATNPVITLTRFNLQVPLPHIHPGKTALIRRSVVRSAPASRIVAEVGTRRTSITTEEQPQRALTELKLESQPDRTHQLPTQQMSVEVSRVLETIVPTASRCEYSVYPQYSVSGNREVKVDEVSSQKIGQNVLKSGGHHLGSTRLKPITKTSSYWATRQYTKKHYQALRQNLKAAEAEIIRIRGKLRL